MACVDIEDLALSVSEMKRRYKEASPSFTVYVNGQKHEIKETEVDPETTVLEFLREKCRLTGTKLGCGEGGCGACAVMSTRVNTETGTMEHRSFNACLTPLLTMHNCAITTVEGLSSEGSSGPSMSLHPIQKVLSDSHGSQCGFCTPGIVMALYAKHMATKAEGREMDSEDVVAALDGNLCRCTGYRPILQAFNAVDRSETAEHSENGHQANGVHCNGTSHSHHHGHANGVANGTGGKGCGHRGSGDGCGQQNGHAGGHCKGKGEGKHCGKSLQLCERSGEKSAGWMVEHERQQGKVFERLLEAVTGGEGKEKEKKESFVAAGEAAPLYFSGNHLGKEVEWFTPSRLEDLLSVVELYRRTERPFKLLVGNTERHIDRVYKRTHKYPLALIMTGDVKEMSGIRWSSEGVRIGCSVSISAIMKEFEEKLQELEERDEGFKGRVLAAYLEQMRWFAGTHVRNMAALGGNIVTASPISDLNPLHVASGAVLRLAALGEVKGGGQVVFREKRMDDGFFCGYRKVDLQAGEVAESLFIPLTAENEHFFAFKQCRRREDDIAIVNAGMRVKFQSVGTDRVPHSPPLSDVSSRGSGRLVVSESSFSFGGMAPFTVSVPSYSEFWKGKKWTRENMVRSLEVLDASMPLPENVPGGMREFRKSLVESFAFKVFLQVLSEEGLGRGRLPSGGSGSEDDSASTSLVSDESLDRVLPSEAETLTHLTHNFAHPQTKALQHNGPNGEDLGEMIEEEGRAAAVEKEAGRSKKHMAGDLHVTGKAIYVDDLLPLPGELHAELVLSTRAHAKILSIDLKQAQAVEGFVRFFDHKDVPVKRLIGSVVPDEEVFASSEVVSVGQPIGVVVASSRGAAREAAMEVRVEYEDLPAILSIPEAIAASSFFDLRPGLPGRDHLHLCRLEGDVDGEMPKEEREGERMELLMGSLEGRSDIQIVEGEVFMKGQEHFYLETNACRVEPGENDEMTVTSSTQNPSKTQKLVSEVTGLPRHKIVSKCKRMGGGFGGKETRSCFIAAYVAIAAQHLQKPIRLMMDRDTDMLSSGQRHSFMGSYKVAINRNTLRLEAADVRVYNNAGWSTDLSVPVCERAVFHIENACMISNLQVRGFVCKTNTPSNTAFRGFGGPQGMFIAETYIEHAAKALGVSREDVLSRNLYRQNDLTHYGMRIQTDTLHEVWGKAMTQFDFEKRKKEVEAFNASNRFVKRGLAVSLSKFGMSFTKTFMNQSGALVHLYQDGTLLVSHAGTEMGQGLHTKVAQVAASRFGLPLSAVYISETSTDKVANTQPTAASVGADLAGMATFIACGQILERLSDFVETEERKAKEKRENVDRQTIIARAATAAHFARVNLTGQGFYATPDVAFDWQRGRGRPFYYFAHGISCSEVQLDTLTGDHAVIRADIIQDVGSSLNPAIDVGQVEGAFTQGLGLFTLEETVFNDKGGMFTKGPGAYKIPSFGDIPHDFRVSLLGKPNTEVETVYSSKGVGEPPLFLASSVFFALKNAAYAARRDHTEAMTNGALKEAPAKDPTDTWHFRLDSPASSEKLRLACWDPLNHSLPEELRGRSLLASSPVLAEREKGKKGEGPERQGVEGSREAARERLEGICKKSVSKPNTVWHPLI